MDVSTDSRTVVAIAVGLLVVTAGCSGGGLSGGGGGDASVQQSGAEAAGEDAPEAKAEAEMGGDAGGAGGGEGDGPPQVRQRAVIRTGQVSLLVEDFGAARRNLTAAVAARGGFVSDSHVEVERVDNETYETGRLVLRVPRENFSAMMARAKAAGEVQSASTNSKDVTDRLVDINARLENLRAERARLRQLYRNASDTEDVLAVEERLSEVQGEIERLQAQKKALQRRVALSTIRIELREPRPDPGPVDPDRWFDTPVWTAFLQSVDGVLTSLRALVVATAYALPYAFVYGLPLVGVGYALRRRRRGRDGGPASGRFQGGTDDAASESDAGADGTGGGEVDETDENEADRAGEDGIDDAGEGESGGSGDGTTGRDA